MALYGAVEITEICRPPMQYVHLAGARRLPRFLSIAATRSGPGKYRRKQRESRQLQILNYARAASSRIGLAPTLHRRKRRSAKGSRHRSQPASEGQIESVDDLGIHAHQFSRLPRLGLPARGRVPSSASLMRAQIVPAQPPHFAAQLATHRRRRPSWGESASLWTPKFRGSVNTLQEQTIIHDSRVIEARVEDFSATQA